MTPSTRKSCKSNVLELHQSPAVTPNPASCSQIRDHSVSAKAVRWGRLAVLTLALSLAAGIIYTIALVAHAAGN